MSPSRGRQAESKRERSELRVYCSECHDTFENYENWHRHSVTFPTCRDGEPIPYDEVQEATAAINNSGGNSAYEADMKQHCTTMYSHLEYDKLVDRTCVQETIKEKLVEPLLEKVKHEVYRRLARDPVAQLELDRAIGTVFDVHRDIETSAKEYTQLKSMINPVKPVPRELIDRPDSRGRRTGTRSGDYCYDVPIQLELEASLASNPELLEQLKAASDSWAQQRPAPGASKTVYVDIADGDALKNHPCLGAAADRSDGSVRLAFILYYDDLEVVNPIGAFHGRHKLGLFYWTLVNLDNSQRMAFANMHLMTVALSSDIDYYGIMQVVSGGSQPEYAHFRPLAKPEMSPEMSL